MDNTPAWQLDARLNRVVVERLRQLVDGEEPNDRLAGICWDIARYVQDVARINIGAGEITDYCMRVFYSMGYRDALDDGAQRTAYPLGPHDKTLDLWEAGTEEGDRRVALCQDMANWIEMHRL